MVYNISKMLSLIGYDAWEDDFEDIELMHAGIFISSSFIFDKKTTVC